MRSRANTRVQIEAPTSLDEYGEPTTGTGKGNPFPASLVERSQTVANPQDNMTPTIIRFAVLRCKQTTDIAVDDIVHDLKTGKRWAVDEIVEPLNPMIGMDKRCQLRRAGA